MKHRDARRDAAPPVLANSPAKKKQALYPILENGVH
jgi:hypothetical protein